MNGTTPGTGSGMGPGTAQVVIVGAGITGLTLAYGLLRRGVDVVVLEAGPRAGGVIQTIGRDGYTLELGPFSVMVRSGAFGELLGELGLTSVDVDADASKKRFVMRDGVLRQVPTSPVGLLKTPLLSLGGRVRVLRGVVRSAPRPGDADETMYEVASRRIGEEAAKYLAGAAAVGIYAAEADELSFDACIPRYANADRREKSIVGMLKSRQRDMVAAGEEKGTRAMVGFDGGLKRLIDRLAEELGDRLVCDTLVERVERVGGAYRVRYAGGEIESNAVVTAIAPARAGGLLDACVPGLAAELGGIEMTGLGVVHLGFRREDVGHPLDGFGFLLPKSERIEPLLGSIWASSIFTNAAPEGRVLVRAIVGGTRWPNAVGWTEGQLIERTYEALKPVLGFRGEPVLTQACYWPGAVPVYRPGHLARVGRVEHLLAGSPGVWCVGNWVGGLGVNDRVVAARALAGEIAALVENRPAPVGQEVA